MPAGATEDGRQPCALLRRPRRVAARDRCAARRRECRCSRSGSRLRPRIDDAEASGIDLAARQAEQTRLRILDAAARQFARKGYGRTRIADIVKAAGITPTVFYTHFKNKRQLFTRTFAVFIDWMQPLADEWSAEEPDLAARLLNAVTLYFGVQALSQNLLGLARIEALQEGGDARLAAQRSFGAMTSWLVEGLGPLRTPERPGPAISDELVAYSLLGALEHTVMRSSWDESYSRRDVLVTHLHVFLAVKALYEGRVDVSDEVARYAGLMDALAAGPPPRPAVTALGGRPTTTPTRRCACATSAC